MVIGILTAIFVGGCRLQKSVAPQQPVAPPAFINTTPLDSVIKFVDIAKSAGIDYEWKPQGVRPLNILQTVGNGCAFLDYNQDGNLDILLVGPKLALYEGDGKGHFKDVTALTGLDKINGHFIGIAVGDYDNDGFDDIYLTGYRCGALLHNEGGMRFKEVTKEAGIPPQKWGTSATFTDIDGDGKLDLYIGNYAQFGPDTKPQLCEMGNHMMSSCGPRFYDPEIGKLYRNLDGKHFADVTKSWNSDKVAGKTLGVVSTDVDSSGRNSLVLANDEVAGNLLRNVGGKFEEIGAVAGIAFQSTGGVQGGMGIDSGDFDNDGKLDLTVATFQHEPKAVYHNETFDPKYPNYTESSGALRIGDKSAPFVAFGVKFLDVDNDGFLDIIFANGHVQDNIDTIDKSTAYRQPLQLFHNFGGKKFAETNGGDVFQKLIVGRGLAVGDFDNDGKMDVLVVDAEGKPLLLHNESLIQKSHWIGLKIVGLGRNNRDGYGTKITLETDKGKIVRVCHADGSYLSSSDARVHFGLGEGAFKSLTVRTPNGKIQIIKKIELDRYTTVKVL